MYSVFQCEKVNKCKVQQVVVGLPGVHRHTLLAPFGHLVFLRSTTRTDTLVIAAGLAQQESDPLLTTDTDVEDERALHSVAADVRVVEAGLRSPRE